MRGTSGRLSRHFLALHQRVTALQSQISRKPSAANCRVDHLSAASPSLTLTPVSRTAPGARMPTRVSSLRLCRVSLRPARPIARPTAIGIPHNQGFSHAMSAGNRNRVLSRCCPGSALLDDHIRWTPQLQAGNASRRAPLVPDLAHPASSRHADSRPSSRDQAPSRQWVRLNSTSSGL